MLLPLLMLRAFAARLPSASPYYDVAAADAAGAAF